MNARRTTACVSTSSCAIVSASARRCTASPPAAEPREQPDPLLEPEDVVALLLGEHAAQDLAEQPDVGAQRRVGRRLGGSTHVPTLPDRRARPRRREARRRRLYARRMGLDTLRVLRLVLAALAFAGIWLWLGDGLRVLGPLIVLIAVIGLGALSWVGSRE